MKKNKKAIYLSVLFLVSFLWIDSVFAQMPGKGEGGMFFKNLSEDEKKKLKNMTEGERKEHMSEKMKGEGIEIPTNAEKPDEKDFKTREVENKKTIRKSNWNAENYIGKLQQVETKLQQVFNLLEEKGIDTLEINEKYENLKNKISELKEKYQIYADEKEKQSENEDKDFQQLKTYREELRNKTREIKNLYQELRQEIKSLITGN